MRFELVLLKQGPGGVDAVAGRVVVSVAGRVGGGPVAVAGLVDFHHRAGQVGGWTEWGAGRPGGEGVVGKFIQPERVFVWQRKERALKPGGIGNLEKSCTTW